MRDHDAVAAGVEIAGDEPRRIAFGAHHRGHAGDARGAAHVRDALYAGHAVLTVDEDAVDAELGDELRQGRRGMIGIDDQDGLIAQQFLLQGIGHGL